MKYLILLILITSCARPYAPEPEGEDCQTCRASWAEYSKMKEMEANSIEVKELGELKKRQKY